MKVAVTGTPGTGKTSATRLLEREDGVEVVHLNEVVREEGLWTERDEARDSLLVDLDAVRAFLGDWEGVVESHLAHYLDAEAVVVLRCHPEALARRLDARAGGDDGAGGDGGADGGDAAGGEPSRKARENAESEALDVVLSEAVDRHGRERVYEIDTTDRTPEAVASELRAVLDGRREPSAGTVDFTEYLG